MFRNSNITPVQLAIINAFAISLLAGLAVFLFGKKWQTAVGSFGVLFLISYFLIRYFTERFIYRRIKLIYKFISQTKATPREELFYKAILPEKSLEEVSKDVEAWATQKKEEVDQLRKTEQYRKEFLQNLSHELKTPIFAIQGYVDTLLSGAMNKEELVKKFLSSTSRNVDRLVNLVNDLDEISRLESGEQLLTKQNFIIQDILHEVYESLSLRATEKQIRLQIKKGCESPLTVYADKEKIRMVLLNLIDNAIKYGKLNGHVIFSGYKTDDGHVLIEISDDGHGIQEEHLPRIFERFYRTDLARSRKEGGSGLGLAICKHILEAHGQRMHVRSTLDVGTTFGFTLEEKK
jgi:two-component system phosphate regulon sensor histidine kinase PhoR